MKKQDRQGSRTPAELERKYNFTKMHEDALAAVSALDRNLDQDAVFNRLTNNGKSQGIYRDENGDIYLNASYLVSGVLKSKDNSTFYLDLVNGILKGQFTEFSIAGKSVNSIAQEIAQEKADTAQKNAEEYADGVAKEAVDKQTQTEVFNKLTNNGAAQGLYYVNGQLYINASYLATGILKSLDESTFYLDLVNGILRANFTEISIAGKAVSWKENEDGTFTLVGA